MTTKEDSSIKEIGLMEENGYKGMVHLESLPKRRKSYLLGQRIGRLYHIPDALHGRARPAPSGVLCFSVHCHNFVVALYMYVLLRLVSTWPWT